MILFYEQPWPRLKMEYESVNRQTLSCKPYDRAHYETWKCPNLQTRNIS